MLINAMVGYDDLAGAIMDLTKGRVLPQAPVASDKNITDMIMKRKLICSVELKEAFGMQDVLLMEMLERMRDSDKIEISKPSKLSSNLKSIPLSPSISKKTLCLSNAISIVGKFFSNNSKISY